MRAVLLLLLALPALAKNNVKQWASELDGADLPRQIVAAKQLGRLGKAEGVDPLLNRLDVKRCSPRLTSAIVESLGKLKDPRALDPLIGVWDYLSSAQLQLGAELPASLQLLRAQVVEAVGEIGTERAAPLLERAVSDADPLVQQKAALGLGAIGDRGSVEALVALLPRGGNTAQAAFEALGRLNDPRARAALERHLDSEDPATQAQAAYALAVGERSFAAKLAAIMGDEKLGSPARLLAGYYLARLGERDGVDFLAKLAAKGKPADQARAIEALGQCGHKHAAAALVDLLDAPETATRLLTAKALGRLGGSRAESALKRLLNDKNPTVRAMARAALEEI